MQFVSIREFRNESAKTLKKLSPRNELVLTSNGKPVAIIVATSGDNVEDSINAIRQAKAMRAVESMRKKAAEKGLNKILLKEINKIIKEARL